MTKVLTTSAFNIFQNALVIPVHTLYIVTKLFFNGIDWTFVSSRMFSSNSLFNHNKLQHIYFSILVLN